jgi:hypothetical protein
MAENKIVQKAVTKKAKNAELVKANVLTNKEPGYIYFIGKDNGLYKMKATWQAQAKKAVPKVTA